MTTAVDFNPLSPEFQQQPYPLYKQARDETPVRFIEALNAWGIFRYEDCAYTFKHPELFSARDFIANAFGEFDPVPEVPSIIAMDPPEHTRLRKLANVAFTPKVIRGMQDRIEKVIGDLLDEAQQKDEFDFVSDFAAYVPVSVTAEILGVDAVLGRGDFKRWTMDLIKAPSRTALPADELAQMKRSVEELRAYFTDQIAYRRKNPGNDLISALVHAEEENQSLTETEILSLVALIQFGGSETPSHLIGTSMWELFQQPGTRARAQADPALFSEVVDETMRHQSPVHFVFQTATQDIAMHGETIPADSLVFSFIGSANRDERVFENPDTFDIDRPGKNKHLGFARGAHYCIGDMLGKLMCGSAVRQALQRMPALHPVEPDMEWMPSFWIRGPKELRVAP
ncbi:cytochrome P450 [Pseudonocardia sp. KRD291]|uniref:cytochrome P450 n=1 Tax=Pseudonocardia sp. KRD291 TaxID=2792007 RepID=UPI001C4A6675|nr:cytochrome P450 [Pseudonocardia sp. KRD291]MBW0100970.1 cytochrome P450 [Pseudonocardia sp. KRD291]